ncbi:phenylacetate-CoA oxygenase subunit PaaJ [Ramlibacter rhizophilus]|uniref:Phenylacetate-CoA oxygenase subunit PaaJ n=1 Tax=Ramlibacter rhizophilus TaxID=1781167 RepID=A0A4Z0BNM1_9BURK|nr:phenylacetate-CoA oxygenase subunit PaaJ [Ramlibacter rhizophilus]
MSQALEAARAALREVTDPEIPVVTIEELGILRELREDAGGVEVVITPTYSGCPAMDQIEDDVRAALARAGLQGRVSTRLAPAWTTDWITPAAREKLRAYGIAPPSHCAEGAKPLRFMPPRAQVAVACPRCGSTNTTEISRFGSTACKSLHRCLDCLEPFDHFKPY